MKVTLLICSMHPASSCQNFSGRYSFEEWYALTHTTVAYGCNFGLSTTCEGLNHAKLNAKDYSVSRLLKPLKVNKSTAVLSANPFLNCLLVSHRKQKLCCLQWPLRHVVSWGTRCFDCMWHTRTWAVGFSISFQMFFNDRLCQYNCSFQLVNRIVDGEFVAAHLETARDTPLRR